MGEASDRGRLDRFGWTEEAPPKLITNDKIRCKDCKFRTDPKVWECEIYEQKPDAVLDGDACPDYRKKKDP